MKTESKEYYDLLYEIQDFNKPSLATLLPGTEKIYEVDLNTRTIEAPEYLSVESDHRSEYIYFKTGRYYDNLDLSGAVCIVQYINALGEPRVFAVPFFDVDTFSDDNQMVFYWRIDQEVTKASGDVEFSIRFYLLDDNYVDKKLIFNLNTLPASSKVLTGIDFDPEGFKPNEDWMATYLDQIAKAAKEAYEKDVYWVVI
jgi:hypothetical protein